MAIVHKLIEGGEQYLGFALAKERAMRKSGRNGAIKYEMGDADIEVRIAGNQSFVCIKEIGNKSPAEEIGGYACLPHGLGSTGTGSTAEPRATAVINGTKAEIKEGVKVNTGNTDWYGVVDNKPHVVTWLGLGSVRYRIYPNPKSSIASGGPGVWHNGVEYKTRVFVPGRGTEEVGVLGACIHAQTKRLLFASTPITSMNSINFYSRSIGSKPTDPWNYAGSISVSASSPAGAFCIIDPIYFSPDGTEFVTIVRAFSGSGLVNNPLPNGKDSFEWRNAGKAAHGTVGHSVSGGTPAWTFSVSLGRDATTVAKLHMDLEASGTVATSSYSINQISASWTTWSDGFMWVPPGEVNSLPYHIVQTGTSYAAMPVKTETSNENLTYADILVDELLGLDFDHAGTVVEVTAKYQVKNKFIGSSERKTLGAPDGWSLPPDISSGPIYTPGYGPGYDISQVIAFQAASEALQTSVPASLGEIMSLNTETVQRVDIGFDGSTELSAIGFHGTSVLPPTRTIGNSVSPSEDSIWTTDHEARVQAILALDARTRTAIAGTQTSVFAEVGLNNVPPSKMWTRHVEVTGNSQLNLKLPNISHDIKKGAVAWEISDFDWKVDRYGYPEFALYRSETGENGKCFASRGGQSFILSVNQYNLWDEMALRKTRYDSAIYKFIVTAPMKQSLVTSSATNIPSGFTLASIPEFGLSPITIF